MAPVSDTTELRAEVADLRAALADVRARLNSSERQIVNFQILVSRLDTSALSSTARSDDGPPGQPPASGGSSTHAPARDPRSVYTHRRIPTVPRAGEGRDSVVALLGQPDKAVSHNDGSATLCYYQQGIRVELDKRGGFKEAVFIGAPEGDAVDINGNSGAFDPKGWYRPQIWQGPGGIEVGMLGTEVVSMLGEADQVTPDTSGNIVMHYKRLDLIVYLDNDTYHTVTGFRIGGGGPRSDLNGNVK